MKSALLSSTALLLLLTSAKAELKLSPTLVVYELDGAKFSQLSFPDGDKQVNYQPPPGWEYAGSGNKLTLRPKDKTSADAFVSVTTLPEPATLDEETVQKLTTEALAGVPNGSTDVQLVSQQRTPVAIDGKETYLMTLSYTFSGERYGRSLMVLNRGKEQIRFQLSCHLSDFTELQQAFLASHFSWQHL